MTRSKLIWLMIPLAIALGAAAGVLATRRHASTVNPPASASAPAPSLAQAGPISVPSSARSPFKVAVQPSGHLAMAGSAGVVARYDWANATSSARGRGTEPVADGGVGTLGVGWPCRIGPRAV